MHRIAVIGGGLAGLTCATRLRDKLGKHSEDCEVIVFDKARGPGGRMSSRRAERGLRFNHGCQYFTATTRRFEKFLGHYINMGLVKPWQGRLATLNAQGVFRHDDGDRRYVCVDGMSAICKDLALSKDSKIDYRPKHRILSAFNTGTNWTLNTDQDETLSGFDFLVLTTPAVQALDILGPQDPLAPQLEQVKVRPTWALMMGFEQPLDLPFDAAFIDNGTPLAWLMQNPDWLKYPASKTDTEPRYAAGCVAHTTFEWSVKTIDQDAQSIAESLRPTITELCGQTPTHLIAHRWRYALTEQPLATKTSKSKPETTDCLADLDRHLILCGDWCLGSRAEAAYLSGHASAKNIAQCIKDKMIN